MAKTSVRYVCQSCGAVFPRWMGKCSDCSEWNSLQEERTAPSPSARAASNRVPSGSAVPITSIAARSSGRLTTGISELDRALGGGLVDGGVVLVGGDPGIGKSTLLTQMAFKVAGGGKTVLYVSGEESPQQVRLRSERLGALSEFLLVASETDVATICSLVESIHPAVVVVDSIQTTYDSSLDSAPGSVTQIRDCAMQLARTAKQLGIPLLLIGHVTKEGTLAGPRVLEHMVDTVLYFEGDRHHNYRILRAVKNRFGSTDEIGIFEMGGEGLREVENPSATLLAERSASTHGSVVTSTLDGSRPLLVEIQALVARSFLSNPRRTATGIDLNRLHMILAVLEKRLGLRLGDQDVYVNVAGGMRVIEPATDLAVALAVASSFREERVDPEVIVVGEVGLSGEVRSVPQAELRLKEAARLGFSRAIVPAHSKVAARGTSITVETVSSLDDALAKALRRGSIGAKRG